MLSIICPHSYRYEDAIKKICQRTGILKYEIIDPKSYDINRTYKFVLVMQDGLSINVASLNATKIWECIPPATDLPVDKKKSIVDLFVSICDYMQRNIALPTTTKKDIPRLKDLEEFLKDYKGQVIEIKTDNGGMIGVFPDGEKLNMDYTLSCHASTILNLSKLYEMFNASSISIKDM